LTTRNRVATRSLGVWPIGEGKPKFWKKFVRLEQQRKRGCYNLKEATPTTGFGQSLKAVTVNSFEVITTIC